MIEYAVRMRCTGRVVVVYGVQVSSVDAQVRLALDVLGIVDGEADFGSVRADKKVVNHTAARVDKTRLGSGE